jgi:hypothetical protein
VDDQWTLVIAEMRRHLRVSSPGPNDSDRTVAAKVCQ